MERGKRVRGSRVPTPRDWDEGSCASYARADVVWALNHRLLFASRCLPCRAKPDETPSFYGVRATIPDGAGDKWPLMIFMLSTTAPPDFTTGEPRRLQPQLPTKRPHRLQCAGPAGCRPDPVLLSRQPRLWPQPAHYLHIYEPSCQTGGLCLLLLQAEPCPAAGGMMQAPASARCCSPAPRWPPSLRPWICPAWMEVGTPGGWA